MTDKRPLIERIERGIPNENLPRFWITDDELAEIRALETKLAHACQEALDQMERALAAEKERDAADERVLARESVIKGLNDAKDQAERRAEAWKVNANNDYSQIQEQGKTIATLRAEIERRVIGLTKGLDWNMCTVCQGSGLSTKPNLANCPNCSGVGYNPSPTNTEEG